MRCLGGWGDTNDDMELFEKAFLCLKKKDDDNKSFRVTKEVFYSFFSFFLTIFQAFAIFAFDVAGR